MWSALLQEAYSHSAIVFGDGAAQFDHRTAAEGIVHFHVYVKLGVPQINMHG